MAPIGCHLLTLEPQGDLCAQYMGKDAAVRMPCLEAALSEVPVIKPMPTCQTMSEGVWVPIKVPILRKL